MRQNREQHEIVRLFGWILEPTPWQTLEGRTNAGAEVPRPQIRAHLQEPLTRCDMGKKKKMIKDGTHHGGVESEDGDGEEGVQDAEEDAHVYGRFSRRCSRLTSSSP